MKLVTVKQLLKRLLFILLFLALCGCALDQQPAVGNAEVSQAQAGKSETTPVIEQKTNYVEVKYRATPVNLAASGFEYHNTDASSFIRGAWYDKQNRYLVMNIDGTYYNYCGVPEAVWEGFKESESYGRYFNSSIKESYEYKNCVGPDY